MKDFKEIANKMISHLFSEVINGCSMAFETEMATYEYAKAQLAVWVRDGVEDSKWTFAEAFELSKAVGKVLWGLCKKALEAEEKTWEEALKKRIKEAEEAGEMNLARDLEKELNRGYWQQDLHNGLFDW